MLKPITFPIRGDKLAMSVLPTASLCHRVSPYQTIDIVETEVFGRMLLLDGHIQLTTFDEHAYHESLVHIPLTAIPSPRSALVVGGGDGGVLRELTRCQSLELIEMVEIDQEVINTSREWLPTLSSGAFDDPRVKVHVADAFGFVKNCQSNYDLIVVDSTDTYEDEVGGLSEALFTERFYRDCLAALKPGGIVVTQADNPVFCPYSRVEVLKQFSHVFPGVGSYSALVPSFGGVSAYVWGSPLQNPRFDESHLKLQSGLRYLNAETFSLAFNFPSF